MDWYHYFPLIVLGLVFFLIAFRQIGTLTLAIWQIMLGGALLVLLSGAISPWNALLAINLDVMLFLFGMFLIGSALEESGYLAHLSYHYFKKAKNLDLLLLFVLFAFGIGSAILMNDTIAIIGTPIMLLLAKTHNIKPKVLLLALAFAVTIGSVMSPIGNPQNLLIALETKMEKPFLVFLQYLLVPTLLNLLVAYLLLRFFYKD
ncbi:MAG: SLC13 family permease, partial [Candidatus Woesearchaeota archaeon]